MLHAKVFISHSAKTADVARHLDAIQERLDASGWVVRLDQSGLDVGDGWRSKLFRWMDEVHAAVLLVSRSALESRFVPIELSVLSFRHVREQNFPLLPVLVDLADCEDLAEGTIGELQLTEIQFLSADEPATTAERVAQRLAEQFGSSGRLRTPRELLEQDAALLIVSAALCEEQLVEAAHVTQGFALPKSSKSNAIFADFAKELLSVGFDVACDALLALGDRRTAVNARRHLLELLDLVAPFWVAESEAAKLARNAMASCDSRSFLLVCSEPWVARAYISRSSMKPLGAGWQVCELPPPESEDEVQWVWKQLALALAPACGAVRRVDRDVVRRRLKRMESRRQPLFLLFPPEWVPTVQLMQRLRQELPTLTVFAMGTTDDLEALRPYACELISQGEASEAAVCDAYDETKVRLAPSQASM